MYVVSAEAAKQRKIDRMKYHRRLAFILCTLNLRFPVKSGSVIELTRFFEFNSEFCIPKCPDATGKAQEY